MRSTLFKANKLLLIEKNRPAYVPAGHLPMEYLRLLVPYAGIYFREDEECGILTQHMDLGPFSLWLHDIFTKHDIVLIPYTPYHIWALHFMYEDSLRAEVHGKDSFFLEEKECNLFNLHPGLHHVPMAGNKKVLSVHVNIRPAALPALAAKYPAFQCLLAHADSPVSQIVNKRPYNVNPVCDLLIQKILTCRYTGMQAHHFLYRCCLDLFLNFAAQEAMSQQPFLFNNILHLDVYHQLFRSIQDHPHRAYTAAELAQQYQIQEEELAYGFRQHFSISIEDFSYMLRMITAYNLLQKEHKSAAMVAATVGFANATDLISKLEAYYECNWYKLKP
ncbi:helix-turn-helix domain-containing protein [Chitinophaga tropicalis]|uniref:HTH araC/xylS-type domain-containing protein n=1 Tax=Chitinophaga tropicalis TaxID=2683588 RepID=A0A7K1U5J9_9BACT|nr:hypothetical protein [Chitinophaga tropicalis]MVT09642.1 hypothetical protein [Chitinophaga tropicalis]